LKVSANSAVIYDLRFETLQIPFKVGFRHSSAAREETSSVWVEAVTRAGSRGLGESCPRPYVTGETIETAQRFFSHHQADIRERVTGLASLRDWMDAHVSDIDANPAAWCAIELALLDAFARDAGAAVEQFLSLPPLAGRFRYTAVLGDAPAPAFRASAEQYRQYGFRDFKVKLSGDVERDSQKLAVLSNWPEPVCVRADANNFWQTADDAIAALRMLNRTFYAIEEPIEAGRYAELARVSAALGCPIVLDESVRRATELAELPGAPQGWIVNVRVSKMGGLLRSLAVVDAARSASIGVIVGAQVGETSLLTRAALPVARAAGGQLVAQEGAFGTFLLERDICSPTLAFGAGGVLDAANYLELTTPGFGLTRADHPSVS
jgi:L-alanine-DL-glutamate epimerase-like enolase superfamily enzyme